MTDIDIPYSTPIDLSKSSALITGGTSGIGLELARSFIEHGAKVIICGRRQNLLDEAKSKYTSLITYKADVGNVEDRTKLASTIIKEHPEINILVNNAGIQRRVPLKDDKDWSDRQTEIDINISAPVHLSTLFADHFITKSQAAIINISSGLAFIPFVVGPVYSATKAFLHNFTISQRWHFENTNVQVIEIAPPAVKSNLGGSHDFGEPTDEFVNAVVKRLLNGEKEIGYKMSDNARLADRNKIQQMFSYITQNMSNQTKRYNEQ